MKNSRIFYGWFIVAAGMLIISAAIGLVSNSFSIFIVPVGEELGFTRSQMSANQTILATGMIVVSFLWGAIIRRFRLKNLMAISAFATCACYFLYSLATKLWMFYAISALLSLSTALLSWMPFSTIIANWFNKKGGFALGLTFMGSGIGGMIFNALGGYLISTVGWRSTIMIYSVILIFAIIPAVLLVVKVKPSDMGLAPFGGELVSAEKGEVLPGMTMAEARRTGTFYIIALCIVLIGICLNSLNTIMNPHLQAMGYSPIFSANAAVSRLSVS